MTKKQIKALRIRLGMTQVQFAAALGAALPAVKSWENGRRTPLLPTQKLMRTLKARA